jgi:hypothetical protein
LRTSSCKACTPGGLLDACGSPSDAVAPQDRSSSSSLSSRRAIRIRGLARAAATGALVTFLETAGARAEIGGAGSSAVWMRGAAVGTAFGADGAASSGLDDGTGPGSGKLGPAMTTTVRGDALTGITARPPTSPAPIAAKPPIIKRSMVRLSSSWAQRRHRSGGMVNGSSPWNIDRRRGRPWEGREARIGCGWISLAIGFRTGARLTVSAIGVEATDGRCSPPRS